MKTATSYQRKDFVENIRTSENFVSIQQYSLDEAYFEAKES